MAENQPEKESRHPGQSQTTLEIIRQVVEIIRDHCKPRAISRSFCLQRMAASLLILGEQKGQHILSEKAVRVCVCTRLHVWPKGGKREEQGDAD